MAKITQHSKIIEMCIDGGWHCQNEFRDNFIFSPHKRRNEIAGKKRESDTPTGKYYFIKDKCQHGTAGQYDYKMLPNSNWINPVAPKPTFRILTSEEVTAQYQKLNL